MKPNIFIIGLVIAIAIAILGAKYKSLQSENSGLFVEIQTLKAQMSNTTSNSKFKSPLGRCLNIEKSLKAYIDSNTREIFERKFRNIKNSTSSFSNVQSTGNGAPISSSNCEAKVRSLKKRFKDSKQEIEQIIQKRTAIAFKQMKKKLKKKVKKNCKRI